MLYNGENPFELAAERRIVGGANFIGRKRNLEEIENRVTGPAGQRGSVAIIGLPDIGKLCLINKAFLERKAELYQRKLVPIKMDFKVYTNAGNRDEFFRDLIASCHDELEDLENTLEDFASQMQQITATMKEVLNEWDTQGASFSLLRRFFRKVLRAGIRVIFILDNFDLADSSFDVARAQWIRELTVYEVTWVLLVCKPIPEFRRLSQALSPDLFGERRLGMFEDEDMESYFRSLAQRGISLTEEQMQAIVACCGRHPYLLSLLGYHLINDYAQQPTVVDVDHSFAKVKERFRECYDRIIHLSLVNENDESKLQKLQQILFGPAVGIEQRDVERMLAYDLIYPNPAWSSDPENTQPAYVAFSEHFQQYLASRLPVEPLPDLLKAEQALCKIITMVFDEQDEETNPLTSIPHPTFYNLFPIILARWDIFQRFFGRQPSHDIEYWSVVADLLTELRRSLMQPQIDAALQATYVRAERYCDEILTILNLLEASEQPVNWKDVFSGSRTLSPGDRLWGRYEIYESLTPTGHSRVMKAWDKKLKRFAAIKVVCLDPADGTERLTRFQQWLEREARIVCGMEHEHIAQVYDLREEAPAIIMKWIDGKSLDQFWRNRDERIEPWPIQVTRLGIKLAKALEHVHNQGIVHRDIKPRNILIRTNGDPVLIDFDAARAVGKEESLLSYHEGGPLPFVGTPLYSAPEQLSNPLEVTTRADIYALGVVLYQALTGGDTPHPAAHEKSAPDPRIPAPLWEILRAMLAEDPRDRPDAQELCQRLEQCLEELKRA
jgi:hypothetical protein